MLHGILFLVETTVYVVKIFLLASSIEKQEQKNSQKTKLWHWCSFTTGSANPDVTSYSCKQDLILYGSSISIKNGSGKL